jgi:hypothetical protein
MVHQPIISERKNILSLSGAGLAALFAILICYRAPVFPTEGLDPSWKSATHYALLKGMTFGVDFTFTSGPFALLYTNYFDRDHYPLMLFVMLVQAASLWAACWFARDRLTTAALLCVGAFVVLPASPDAIFFATAFAIFILALNDRAPSWFAQVLVLSFALLALAKFSFLLIGLALFGLVDLARWFEQRCWPRYATTFLLACFGGYWAAGQPPTAFPAFFLNSLDAALGYSKAMPNFGLSVPVAALAGTIFLCVIGFVTSALTVSPDVRNRQLIRIFGFIGFTFVVFKSAAVREGHDAIAWQSLALSAGFLSGEISYRRLARFINAGAAAASIIMAAFFLSPYPLGQPGYLSWRFDALSAQIGAFQQLASPGAALKEFEARNDEALQRLASAAPQGLTGSVGSVPWDFAEVIAAGYEFKPQPSFQTYASYTSRLRQKDLEYFAGSKRPDNLLFSLMSIDGRYPTLDLGSSLLEILRNYDPIGVWKSGLVLRSRTTQRQFEWDQAERIHARIGEWANVKSTTDLSFVKTAIQTRLIGQAIAFVFKQPHLWLDVRFSDGRMISRRFVPQLAETGFALVPFEVGAHELFRISFGEDQERARPVAIRLRPMNVSSSFAYGTEFEWEHRSFRLLGRPEHPFAVKDRPVLSVLLNAKVEKSAGHRSIPEGYFAHSGTKLIGEIQPTGELRGSFGFLDSALRVGQPGPVRFSIKIQGEDGSEANAFERVLDPVAQPADRGRQTFVIPMPKEARRPVRLIFETSPTTDRAGWGWTYWGDDPA